MKKFLFYVVNICLIVSLLIPSGLVEGTKNLALDPVASSGLYRTRVTIDQPYDLTRLQDLGIKILEQESNWTSVLVSDAQLEDLARLGFKPQASNELTLLVSASADVSPWLATSLSAQLDQAIAFTKSVESSQINGSDVDDSTLIDIIEGFSIEQLAGIQALPGVDNDADGLTDTQESWWCTDPNNGDSDSDGRSDYAEIQAIKDWMANRSAVAPGETPWASWPFDPVACPDKDYDSIPNLAERWELGLNMDLESTDRDKFDDGQEVFGVTYCPGGDYSCGYGDLPRSSDAGYVGQVMPSWVMPPGNHPFVAAFPVPNISLIPSSIVVETVTEITTDHVISSGTEVQYSTTTTKGQSRSEAETETWNEWEEVQKTEETKINILENDSWFPTLEVGTSAVSILGILASCGAVVGTMATGLVPVALPAGAACIASLATYGISLDQVEDALDDYFKDDLAHESLYNDLLVAWSKSMDYSQNLMTKGVDLQNDNQVNSLGSDQYYLDGSELFLQKYFEVKFPSFTPTTTTSNGKSWGGSKTITTEEYEENAVTNGNSFSDTESWGDATAVDTVHAADLWFSYSVSNKGTDSAREIRDISFNIFLNDNEYPIATYFAATDIGGGGTLYNFQPEETHTFTSGHISLTLEQMKQIDLGGTLRIVPENYSFGADEQFYSNVITGNVQIAIDDDSSDGDETIDYFMIPTYNNEVLVDTLKRYFPTSVDSDGDLIALWTPEYIPEAPGWCDEPLVVGLGEKQVVWCKHSLTTMEWWNVYSRGLGNGSEPLQDLLAVPGGIALFRINKDTDRDGYSDRSEERFYTDPYDSTSFPKPELIAGLHSSRTADDVTSTLTLLNTGIYDAYGIKAIMIAPDDTITITNNIVGGSGRVNSGKSIAVGSRVLKPEYSLSTWAGSANPSSGGYFTGTTDQMFTFTVSCSVPSGCVIGQDPWLLNWSNTVTSGSMVFDSTYKSPTPIDVDESGVKISFSSGFVINGNSFVISAKTPRDTFKFTINVEPYTEPIVIVSYNDPQGNHRFVLPETAMNLNAPSDNLTMLSGSMLDINGVEITTNSQFLPGSNTVKVVVDNPTEKTIQDGHMFLNILDSVGSVVLEVPVTQDFQPGPNIIEINWDTAGFVPAYDPDQEYIVMAFWTDYEGNILDASGRPLSSFQTDPTPEFAIAPSDETWDFGTTAQGTILKRQFSFANTGERTLLTYVEAPEGLLVSQTGSKLIGPADMATYEITLNTNELSVGDFSDVITIHTSDPANPTRTIAITGSIAAGEASLPVLINQLPLDYAVTVPGPQFVGNWHSFTHPLDPSPQSIHPVKVYSADYSTLHGMGKYAYEFGTGTGGFNLFGDGRNGNLTVVTGETRTNINATRTNINGSAGSKTATVSSSTNFSVGDLVLIHQTQGTSNVGKWEYNFIASISGTTWTLTNNLAYTYNSSSGKAQVIKVPQYQNVTVQSGGTIATPAWNGSTGGITVFLANGTVNIAGAITSTGSGYRRGDRGEYLDPVRSQGWQGESTNVGTAQSRYRNNGGGGGGMGDDDESCGADKCMGAGGGGGGYGSAGIAGTNTQSGIYGGEGGYAYGSSNLITSALFGSGGGGGGADGDNSTRYGGYGGTGGGLIIVSGSTLTITGSVTSNGTNGLSGASGDGIRTGGGGGGSGGAVLLTGSTVTLGPSKVTALAGAGGAGINGGGNGGSGGVGRVFVQFCDTRSGSTNPGFNEIKINCHIAEQVETSPYTTTRLQMPESFTTSKTYAIKYGRRLVFSASGNQTTTLRLPAGYLKSADLDILISNAGVGALSIQVDFGADGTNEIDWSNTVNNLIVIEGIFTAGYNQWWSTSSGQLTGTVDVPVKITLSKAAQILITDVKVSTYGSSLNHIQLESGSYSEVSVDIKATGTTNPFSLGIDVGDDGIIDQSITVNSPSNPHYITSNNLASQVNTYLSGLTGLVNVPIRLFLFNAEQAGITNFSASIIGNKDVSLSVSDITFPAADPMETDVVPVSAMFHNNGNLPTGNFTAGFFASTADIGEWYIGSALLPSILPGQSASAEILWNTSGFTGSTMVTVKADPFDHIQETSEENNQAVGEVYVRTRPDLSVTAIDPSDPEPKIGELIQIAVIEKNLGETDTSSSTLAIYDGNPDDGGTLIGEQSAGLIGGSETSFVFDWQPITTGWHRLYVKPDVTNAVDEFDEENNLSWQDVYVGLAGPILLDSGTANDPVYSPESGFGYIDINLPDQVTTCGLGNLAEDTVRRDPDGKVLYQFDHLLPGHFYHLDITLYECDGAGRQEYVLVDDNQIAGPEDLGDGQVHRLSLRLDPAFYVDRSVTIAIQADGIDGAVVSEVNLHDIDYRYADAGGGDDPQYPGDEGYGWIDGDAITTWGILPYKSVRVDQIDSELRYQYDNLDPEKRYNVHFTFWQPDGTGRVLKVQVDGIDTGLTVNTGDYLRHQEKIAIPVNAYSTDGSVVISIVRTNATTGAMVNEIALEEETVTARTGCVALETPYFSETYGSVMIENLNAPLGSVVQALNPRGDTVGCFTVTSEGSYGFMRIYGEDTSETPIIPGMRAGEMVEYRVNGAPAISSPLFYWSDDHAAHNINLNAGNITGQTILLNTGWNLVSFNVEPPTPLVSTVLNSIQDRYSRVLGENGIYVPTLPDEFNTLRELHTAYGYYIRVTGTTSVSLLVEGLAQDCSTPKQLHAGWNWIGAPCAITPTAEALQGIAGYYQRVLSLNKTYDPALPQYSTLLNLTPGEGYLIYLTEPVTLIYPDVAMNLDIVDEVAEDSCSLVSATPFSTLTYGYIHINTDLAAEGSLVEFITPRGEVAGCSLVAAGGLLPLTQIYGADGENIGGFLEGEEIFVRVDGIAVGGPLDFTWQDDKTPHELSINITIHKISLPLITH